MPWHRPTPQQNLQNIQAEIDVALPGADARVRRSVENVIARVLAMCMHELYGFLEYIAQQILVSTADEENVIRHGGIWGITRKVAAKATGTILFSGTNGVTIVENTILKRGDDIEYVLDADVTIADGVGTGAVTAVAAGAAGNSPAGTKLTLMSPVAGVASETTVQAPGLVGGTEIEGVEEQRARILERIQAPPQGGAEHDYIAWAKSMPGVTRAWCYPEQQGPGTVSVTFVMDNKEGTIIPSEPEVEAVENYIQTVRPATGDLYVFAPTPVPVDFTINLSPNTAAIQNSVKAEIEDLLRREAAPGRTLYLSRIREAVSTAEGEFDNIVVEPNANVVSAFGELSIVGNFTFGGI